MKILKGIVESPIQPNTTDVAWLKGNTLKHFSNGKWTEIGVPIVDSVDKLDPNAKQGSLASVAVNIAGEVSFSELYQPTSDEVKFPETGIIVDTTNLSSVSGISVNSSYGSSARTDFMIYLFSKDFDIQGEVGHGILLSSGMAVTVNNSTQEENEFELFTLNGYGTITVNEGNLAIINNLLSSTEFVYGGVISMESSEFLDPSYADMFYKCIGREKRTELYIKDGEGWKLLGREIENKVHNLNTRVEDLQTSVEGSIVNLENSIANLKDETNIIAKHVHELPSDMPIGTLGQVLEGKDSLVSFVDYIDTEVSATLLYPETLPYEMPLGEVATFDVYYNQWLNFRLEFKKSYDGNYWLDTYTNDVYTGPAVRYNGNYAGAERTDIEYGILHPFNYDRVTARRVRQPQVLDAFILAKVITYVNPKLYVLDEDGWKQYSELVNQSVTTEKVADGAITLDKLSPELQELLNSLKTT